MRYTCIIIVSMLLYCRCGPFENSSQTTTNTVVEGNEATVEIDAMKTKAVKPLPEPDTIAIDTTVRVQLLYSQDN